MLDHEPTLDKVIKKLPSAEGRARYVQFTVLAKNEGKSAYAVMQEFMEAERKIMRRLSNIEVKPSDDGRGAGGRKCGAHVFQ